MASTKAQQAAFAATNAALAAHREAAEQRRKQASDDLWQYVSQLVDATMAEGRDPFLFDHELLVSRPHVHAAAAEVVRLAAQYRRAALEVTQRLARSMERMAASGTLAGTPNPLGELQGAGVAVDVAAALYEAAVRQLKQVIHEAVREAPVVLHTGTTLVAK